MHAGTATAVEARERVGTGRALQPDLQLLQVSCQLVFCLVARQLDARQRCVGTHTLGLGFVSSLSRVVNSLVERTSSMLGFADLRNRKAMVSACGSSVEGC